MKPFVVGLAAVSLLAACEAPPPAPIKYMVFFDWDRAVLTSQAQATLTEAANAARAGYNIRVDVVGHADTSGESSYNQALSLRRSNAVRNQLVTNGVNGQAIAVSGRGETALLVQTGDGIREPQNRRAEITLVR
jgi:OOP family OmpA-OmpF porin